MISARAKALWGSFFLLFGAAAPARGVFRGAFRARSFWLPCPPPFGGLRPGGPPRLVVAAGVAAPLGRRCRRPVSAPPAADGWVTFLWGFSRARGLRSLRARARRAGAGAVNSDARCRSLW